MGNDGGTVPTRAELVKTKEPVKKLNPLKMARLRWLTCALSKETLKDPIVSDQVGQLFNKSALLQAIIAKELPKSLKYIRGLKDLTDVHFSLDKSYDENESTRTDQFNDLKRSPFECPITNRPVNGQYPFTLIKPCGHVVSDKALAMTKGGETACFVCFKPYSQSDLLALNPPAEVIVEKIAAVKEEQRLARLARREKNPKKRKLEGAAADAKKSKKLKLAAKGDQPLSLQNAIAVSQAVKISAEKKKSQAYAAIFHDNKSDTMSEASGTYLTGVAQH